MIKFVLIVMAISWGLAFLTPILNNKLLKNSFWGWYDLSETCIKMYADLRKNIIFYGIIIIASIFIITYTSIGILGKIAIGIIGILHSVDLIKDIIFFFIQIKIIITDNDLRDEPLKTKLILTLNAILVYTIQILINYFFIYICIHILF